MFTGIVEEVGQVQQVEALTGGRRLRLACSFADELRPDESVAVNGCCLTVTERDAGGFWATAVEETLQKTSLGQLAAGDGVNLERALRLGDRLDGHLVQGHVDATAEVLAVDALADSWLVRVSYPPEHARYLIPVGSVALDGVSLTVARLEDRALTVSIIPHTWQHTTLATWVPGRHVNVEYDPIGKYVARSMRQERRDRNDRVTHTEVKHVGISLDRWKASNDQPGKAGVHSIGHGVGTSIRHVPPNVHPPTASVPSPGFPGTSSDETLLRHPLCFCLRLLQSGRALRRPEAGPPDTGRRRRSLRLRRSGAPDARARLEAPSSTLCFHARPSPTRGGLSFFGAST